MSISAMKQALEALGKLADETPTTHVRAGKAQIEGKEVVALWFDDCSDPIQQATYINATKPSKLKEFLGQVREHLSRAIAEAEKQEPVAWDGDCVLGYCRSPGGCEASNCCRGDYTKPPRHEWVVLTNSESEELIKSHWGEMKGGPLVMNRAYIRDIEARLKEKNT